MANVIKTVLTYPLDGSARDFNIPFEYLARKFVVVTLIGVDRKVLTINTDYRFATRTTISLTKAWGTADGYTTIELRRVTSTTDRLVDFTDGSILRAYDLNVAQIQTMHVAEEARDLTADTIGVNNDGHLDARGRRIVNLANAVDDRDAVPFGQLKAMNQNSWQARNEALQFRNEAETFRNQAEGFKNESSTNATNTNQWRNEAEGFRDEAEQFKNTATQQATAASDSAAAAHQSEVNAANSAKESANSATLAEQQADRAEREADKLGNWNALAGAVEDVNQDHVVSWSASARFKGELTANRSITMRAPNDYNSMGQMVHEYDGTDGQYVSNTYWAIKHPHRGEWHVPFQLKNLANDSATWELHFGDYMHCYNGLRVEGYGKPLGVTNQANTSVVTYAYGPGDLTQGAWVCNTRWSFYDSGLEIGWVRGGSTNGNGLIRWKPEGTQATFHDIWLNPGGMVQFPAKILVGPSGASVGEDGNIGGSLWGGNLYGWLRANTVNHIAMGSVNWAQLWRAGGVDDGGGKVITGITNPNGDDLIDGCQWRVMQYVRNDGQRFNIY